MARTLGNRSLHGEAARSRRDQHAPSQQPFGHPVHLIRVRRKRNGNSPTRQDAWVAYAGEGEIPPPRNPDQLVCGIAE